jgi:hypothetical protein
MKKQELEDTLLALTMIAIFVGAAVTSHKIANTIPSIISLFIPMSAG